jgi:DNA end-binding protein Ku
MPRPLWKGSISFGLVTIPVQVFSATRRSELRFRQLDRRDKSPIHEVRVSEKSGREVPWDDIVRGYEYDEGQFVILEPDDFERANVKATQTIEIVQAVPRDAVPPAYFESPQFVMPAKTGVKPYHVLRETLRRTDRIAIATVVMRGRQHLAALLADERVITLELLRFAHELKAVDEIALDYDVSAPELKPKEIEMAEQLVAMLDAPWEPQQFHDDYRDDLLELIEAKARQGGKATAPRARRADRDQGGEVVDMMELLKKSVGQARQRKRPARRRAAS